ncbi:MAG: prepilin-type N-terminal cleavage/methylation domain-containing protein [Gemmatimonadetes bacterium]|nr:prepilin-type N-terminal cleavage/methylation domain-containing protein [Gemmatimonadota bacterium]
MSRTGFTLLELLIAITLVSILAAIASATVKSAKDAAYIAVLQSELEKLSLAQEVYFAERAGYFGESGGEEGTYTKKIGQLDFAPSPNVRIRMRANQNGWSARAEHLKRSPDKFFCAIFVGDAKPYRPSTEEGAIKCEPRSTGKK